MKNPNSVLGTLPTKPGTVGSTTTVLKYSMEDQMEDALDKLLDLVEEKTGILRIHMMGGSRPNKYATARRLYYAVADEVVKPQFESAFSYSAVSAMLEQDHTTAISAVKRHVDCMDTDPAYKEMYRSIVDQFMLILNPITTEGFIATRIGLARKIQDYKAHLAQVDAELKQRGYAINEEGKPVKQSNP